MDFPDGVCLVFVAWVGKGQRARPEGLVRQTSYSRLTDGGDSPSKGEVGREAAKMAIDRMR
jgi:hypothetical protein